MVHRKEREDVKEMFETMNNVISWIDGAVWGLPLIILILCTGIYLSVSMGFLQIRHLGKALKFMVKNEEGGKGEVSSFGALCTAMSVLQPHLQQVVRDHYSGWLLQHFLEWQPNIPKVCWQSNIVLSIKKVMYLADHSTISKMVWV